MPNDDNTAVAAASSEVIEISSNECKSSIPTQNIDSEETDLFDDDDSMTEDKAKSLSAHQSIESKYEKIDSEETVINDAIMETIDLLDSDSECGSNQPIESLRNGKCL